MTIYYYRKGIMVGMKKQFEDDFIAPTKCVEEKIFDTISYDAHIEHYRKENIRLQKEFREDLISKYDMTDHPQKDKLFDKAWEFAGSLGLSVVEDYFESLIEILQDDTFFIN